jgi:hypothetical protein
MFGSFTFKEVVRYTGAMNTILFTAGNSHKVHESKHELPIVSILQPHSSMLPIKHPPKRITAPATNPNKEAPAYHRLILDF